MAKKKSVKKTTKKSSSKKSNKKADEQPVEEKKEEVKEEEMPKVEETAVNDEVKVEEPEIQPEEFGTPKCRHLFYFILGALVILALVMYFKPAFIIGDTEGISESETITENVEITKYICPDGEVVEDKNNCNLEGLKVICCDGTVVQKKEYCLNKDCFTN